MRPCFSCANLLSIYECSTLSPCDANATCNNTECSYTSKCDSGYHGDGVFCNFGLFCCPEFITLVIVLDEA